MRKAATLEDEKRKAEGAMEAKKEKIAASAANTKHVEQLSKIKQEHEDREAQLNAALTRCAAESQRKEHEADDLRAQIVLNAQTNTEAMKVLTEEINELQNTSKSKNKRKNEADGELKQLRARLSNFGRKSPSTLHSPPLSSRFRHFLRCVGVKYTRFSR